MIRLSYRMRCFMDGTSLMQQPEAEHGYGPAGERVKAMINGARVYADRSIRLPRRARSAPPTTRGGSRRRWPT